MGDGTMRTMLLALLAMVACSGPPRQAVTGPPAMPAMLRVGVSPDAPPVAFMREGRIVGIEPDLGQALADQSRRSLALIPMGFDELLPALLDGRVDVVMSGMSVTPARQVRVAFADPYMRGGLMPACRRADGSKFATRQAIVGGGGNVGVRAGSTAESWAQANLRYANVAVYPTIADAARELAQGRLDLIVSDAPQVAWAVSEHSGVLQVVRVLLTQEDIAWAFRPQDVRLRDAANAALAAMRQDGRLRAILQRWIPYLDQLERARSQGGA
jgi:ABC-type amino acid transport substrate-binding protein